MNLKNIALLLFSFSGLLMVACQAPLTSAEIQAGCQQNANAHANSLGWTTGLCAGQDSDNNGYVSVQMVDKEGVTHNIECGTFNPMKGELILGCRAAVKPDTVIIDD